MIKLRLILTFIILYGCSYAQNKETYIVKINQSEHENKPRKAYRLSKKFYKKNHLDTLAIKCYAYYMSELNYSKRKEKVLKLYDELIRIDTNNINFYNVKNEYLLKIEDYENGIILAKNTLRKKSNIETNYLLALLYEGKKDTVNSNLYFSEAFKIDSNDSFLNYKFAYTMYYRKNYSYAAKYFIRFIDLITKKNEKNSFAFVPDLIIALWHINDKEKALYYWKKYSKDNIEHYNYRFGVNDFTKEIKKYCEEH